jgi:hypothetical protein
MRHAIDTAPKNRHIVIIEDVASGSNDIAHWSPESSQWVGKDGEPSEVTPTHWRPIPTNKPVLEDTQPEREDGSALELLLGDPLDGRKITPYNIDLKAEPNAPSQGSHVWRRGIALSIALVLVMAAASVVHYADPREAQWAGAISQHFSENVIAWLSRFPRRVYPRLPQQLAESDRDSRSLEHVAKEPLETGRAPEGEARQENWTKQPAEVVGALDERALELQRQAATAAQLLSQEREKAAALMLDVQAARQALSANEAQYRQVLEEEHTRSNELARELAAARREVTAKSAISSKTGDELTKLKEASEAEATKLGGALQQERDHGTAMANDLAAARKELEAKEALLSEARDELARLKEAAKTEAVTAAALAQSLQQEHDMLTSELATAHRDLEAKTALLNTAGDAEARVREASEAKDAELLRSLQRERDKVTTLERELESARLAIETHAKPDPTANGLTSQTERAMASAAAAKPPVVAAIKDNREVVRLIAHASSLLTQGNIGAGRIFLERAVEAGSAEASFALAETYDPYVLSRWGTYGTRGDASKARELYEKAMAGGIQEASDRLNALHQ